MSTEPAPRGRVVPVAIGAALAAALLTAGAVVATTGSTPQVQAAAASAPVPDPVLQVGGPAGPRAAVPWSAPLTVSVTGGTLREVAVTDPDGSPLAGTTAGTTWTSTAPDLLPAATYRVAATAVDAAGKARALQLIVRTTRATRVLHATLSPGDDAVVGVGQPVVVTLDHPVKNKADRAAVEQRLTVSTVPAVQGAWRWMENNELHYRGPSFWQPGTKITVTSDLKRLKLSNGTWGSGRRSSTYAVGDAMVSTVDVASHTMTVTRNGAVLKVLKVSTGRPEYETHNGVHLVLEKTKLKTMDSSTIGIPRNGPGGYFLKVPNSVRISYSGEFVHSAPGTVRQQGVANVSHGCVNLAPADAAWFYPLAKRGDVVRIVGSPRKPLSYDPGTSDWNTPFSEWAS
ncbi:MAG: L,D-transpeptidase family protein [Actinobacteria bacterium]|nr:L,D-transpeptidase family protein [Actinomycetota bacterium]MCA1721289.1 L,D-transpeptidase family protein [Actinomycetota bacterium]